MSAAAAGIFGVPGADAQELCEDYILRGQLQAYRACAARQQSGPAAQPAAPRRPQPIPDPPQASIFDDRAFQLEMERNAVASVRKFLDEKLEVETAQRVSQYAQDQFSRTYRAYVLDRFDQTRIRNRDAFLTREYDGLWDASAQMITRVFEGGVGRWSYLKDQIQTAQASVKGAVDRMFEHLKQEISKITGGSR